MGVSVDGFGAGFTSLAYLSSLAVNELKLDRSFVNGLSTTEGSRDLALIRSTISLARALGLRVVAEGVEEQASLELLSGFGCDVAQGYLISKPKPAAELSLEPPGLSSRLPVAREQVPDQRVPDSGWGERRSNPPAASNGSAPSGGPLPARSNP